MTEIKALTLKDDYGDDVVISIGEGGDHAWIEPHSGALIPLERHDMERLRDWLNLAFQQMLEDFNV
jgi:hypothetical protein